MATFGPPGALHGGVLHGGIPPGRNSSMEDFLPGGLPECLSTACFRSDFTRKSSFSNLVGFWSEPGPGSARNGFLAKNYVGLTNYQPKRLSGRPFRGQNMFYEKLSTLIRH